MKCLTAYFQTIVSKICGTGFTRKTQLARETVGNDEELYRRVPADGPGWIRLENGDLRLSASAFNDPAQKPSVNRALLRSNVDSKNHVSDGIYVIVASDVRRISTIRNEPAVEGETALYAVDVLPRPIFSGNTDNEPENISHAQIETNPRLKNSSRFKKLKEALAHVANEKGRWSIYPSLE